MLAHTVNLFHINILPPLANPYEHYDQWYRMSVIYDILGKSGWPRSSSWCTSAT
jgi:hypothetical protein